MSRFYFHCSDGVDLVLDREGIEIDASDVLLSPLRAAERLFRALPSYDDWSAWTVSVHDERGSLVETLPFPANTARRYALHLRRALRDGLHTCPPPAPDRKHPVSLMRLRQAQCRCIISAPEQKPMFCGEATKGGSWCAWHPSIVYRNDQPVSTSLISPADLGTPFIGT